MSTHAALEAPPGRVAADAVARLVGELGARFGNRLTTAAGIRESHGKDPTWHPGAPPDAVFFAQATDEVAAAVAACARHGVPVIPYGTGTSLEGHIAALRGGLSIDLSQMDRIVEVNQADLDATVEAGVTRGRLNEHLRDTGLFFPVDPGADASLGGMAATRASGTNAVRYGTMRENVVRMTAVLADGQVIRTGARTRKSSAGYDLTRLLVGSEGTLGVITEVTLRLFGIPEAIAGGVCPFATLQGACEAVILTIQSGIPVARIELVDEVQIRGINLHAKLGLAETPTLFVEFHGSPASVAEQSERFAEIAADCGGGDFTWGTTPEERSRLWRARHEAYFAARALAPGCEALATDVCVPISRLADCVSATRADIDATGLVGPIAGHAGDGNFHVSLMFHQGDAAEEAKVHGFLDRLVARAHAMDGTCTGEHGVGHGKIKHMAAEHGAALAPMRAIKRALDPQNIMNPGKILPER